MEIAKTTRKSFAIIVIIAMVVIHFVVLGGLTLGGCSHPVIGADSSLMTPASQPTDPNETPGCG